MTRIVRLWPALAAFVLAAATATPLMAQPDPTAEVAALRARIAQALRQHRGRGRAPRHIAAEAIRAVSCRTLVVTV